MSQMSRYHRSYRQARDRLRKRDQTCHLCGQPIDVTLPYTHPQSWTADHLTPIAKGGHVLGAMRAAHKSCNSRRGVRDVPADPPTSRRW